MKRVYYFTNFSKPLNQSKLFLSQLKNPRVREGQMDAWEIVAVL